MKGTAVAGSFAPSAPPPGPSPEEVSQPPEASSPADGSPPGGGGLPELTLDFDGLKGAGGARPGRRKVSSGPPARTADDAVEALELDFPGQGQRPGAPESEPVAIPAAPALPRTGPRPQEVTAAGSPGSPEHAPPADDAGGGDQAPAAAQEQEDESEAPAVALDDDPWVAGRSREAHGGAGSPTGPAAPSPTGAALGGAAPSPTGAALGGAAPSPTGPALGGAAPFPIPPSASHPPPLAGPSTADAAERRDKVVAAALLLAILLAIGYRFAAYEPPREPVAAEEAGGIEARQARGELVDASAFLEGGGEIHAVRRQALSARRLVDRLYDAGAVMVWAEPTEPLRDRRRRRLLAEALVVELPDDPDALDPIVGEYAVWSGRMVNTISVEELESHDLGPGYWRLRTDFE